MDAAAAVKRVTTVIFVERIEPVLDFWVERLGFEKTVEVPEGEGLGFAILQKDGTELMYQTRSSAEADVAAVAALIKEPASVGLFIEVESLDATMEQLAGLDRIVEERTTFYGAREVGVLSPCGTPVVFAEFSSS